MSDEVISSSLFRLMDTERDGQVNFTGFAHVLSLLMRGSPRAQLQCIYFIILFL